MDPVLETTVKNNLWRKMSHRLNKEGVSRLAAAFRKACSRWFVCGQTKPDDNVARSYNGDIVASFNIPDINADTKENREAKHPSNAEILAQVDSLEKRFKQQSIILEKHGLKRPKINIGMCMLKIQNNFRSTSITSMKLNKCKMLSFILPTVRSIELKITVSIINITSHVKLNAYKPLN